MLLKPNKNSKGFIKIPILVAIIVGVLIVGVGGYFGIRQYQNIQNKKIVEAEQKAQNLITAQQKELEENKKEIEGLKNQEPKVVVKETPVPIPDPSKQPVKDTKDHGDNDGDHLENWIEDEIGTNKDKADTDGDGVPDALDEHPLDNSSIINKIYQVKDDTTGLIFPIRINIPLDAYIMFKSKLRHDFKADASNIVGYAKAEYGDIWIQHIVTQVLEAAVEHDANWYQMFRNLVAEIVYNEDSFTGFDEYPKYPVETLVDGSGDCEDTSILLASLLRGFQYRWQTNLAGTPIEHDFDDVNIGFLVMSGHIAAGYWVPEFEQIFNPAYKYYGILDVAYYTDTDGKKYCYVETTSNDFAVCEVPKQVKELTSSLHIYPLK